MATKSNKQSKQTVTFKGAKGINAKFTPSKSTKNKASRKTAKRSTSYETVQTNIQKITYPSGTVSYRVRVAGDSQFATSLKKAREIRKSMIA
jgi:hypothetical protein